MDEESRDDRRDVGYIEYQEREGVNMEELDAVTQHRRKVTWHRVTHSVNTVWAFFLSTSYIPAIIFMMVSVIASNTAIEPAPIIMGEVPYTDTYIVH